MTALFIRTKLAVTSQMVSLLTALRGRAAANRGVTFVEYALLAAIAVIVAVVFRNTLINAFQTLFERVRDTLATSPV